MTLSFDKQAQLYMQLIGFLSSFCAGLSHTVLFAKKQHSPQNKTSLSHNLAHIYCGSLCFSNNNRPFCPALYDENVPVWLIVLL